VDAWWNKTASKKHSSSPKMARPNIDLGAMEHAMKGAGLPIEPVDHAELGFDNVERGFIGTDEPAMHADFPRTWFAAELKKAGAKIWSTGLRWKQSKWVKMHPPKPRT
jgi:hypothetical protein